MAELKPIIEESMIQYAGAVLQSRALVDVRDGLKPSARQIFYSMLLHKLTSKNPYKKTANAVGLAMADFYIHGDSSCEGVIMRAGQPFAMRYPLIDVKGNAGTLIESGNWAAMRYTESRLSKLADALFGDIDKNTIDEWRDSYDNTKQFPAVLPSKGFYNIVNGTSGIGIGMASSIPQYNIKELNKALIYLIDHPDCSFDDIYCAPDFATGAILYNESEVKESMKKGTGFACKLRSIVEFNEKERCFVVTEIPYGVYTNTICMQLENIVNGEDNPGIERFNDLTGEKPLIKIYLSKKANPDNILKYLYKNTSLQSCFGINFTMLDGGKFPRVFTWKEMLQSHIDHEKKVYIRGYKYDLNKIENRIHIIDGLLTCLANIDEVVHTIKTSQSTEAASLALQRNFSLDEIQAKAVLDMKLSRLAHLEVEKLVNEKTDLLKKANAIHQILENESLLNDKIKEGWVDVANKYGDGRRTRILNLAEDSNNEPIEKKRISVLITNKGTCFAQEINTLYVQKRNGVGSKFKFNENEFVVSNIIGDTVDTLLVFTDKGNFYHMPMSAFSINDKQFISSFIPIKDTEKIVAVANLDNFKKKYILFITKNGILKKSELSEYNLKRNSGAIALKLDTEDEIISVLFVDDEKIGILTSLGNFVIINTKDVRSIGRVAKGVIGIKLNENDFAVSAKIVPQDTKIICSISKTGQIKKTSVDEFKVTGRGTKGVKIQKVEGEMCDFICLSDEGNILVISSKTQICLATADISLTSRGAQGVKALKLPENSIIVKIRKISN